MRDDTGGIRPPILVVIGLLLGAVLAVPLTLVTSSDDKTATPAADATVTATPAPAPTVTATVSAPGPRVTVTATTTPATTTHDWEKIIEFGNTAASFTTDAFYVPKAHKSFRICWNREAAGSFKLSLGEAGSGSGTVVEVVGPTKGCKALVYRTFLGYPASGNPIPLVIEVESSGGTYTGSAEWK